MDECEFRIGQTIPRSSAIFNLIFELTSRVSVDFTVTIGNDQLAIPNLTKARLPVSPEGNKKEALITE